MPDLSALELPALELIRPDWPAPSNIRAFTTTRRGGFSEGPWSSLNLGNSCGDDSQHVEQNRQRLHTLLPAEPHWIKQVHGNCVLELSEHTDSGTEADAVISTNPGQVCTVLHADCLPILFCNHAGTKVAAAHAGWRGLAAGVVEATILAMDHDPDELMAWLGPAIGPTAFEVGQNVYDAFVDIDVNCSVAFRPYRDRWLADLYQLARLALLKAGVRQVYGGQYCTYLDQERLFSYRRDGVTGRMATLVWMLEASLESERSLGIE